MTFPYYEGHSYAEIIGKEYYRYQGMFQMAAVLTGIFSSIQCYRAWIRTNHGTHFLQKRMLIIISAMTLFFIIQSIDPQGYCGILPPIVEGFASDTSTFLGLVILFVFINSINKLFNFQSPIDQWSKADISPESIFWTILAIVIFISGIVFSILQVTNDRATFRGVKLIVFSLLIAIAFVRTDILMWKTYQTIKRCEMPVSTNRLVIHMSLFNAFVPIIVITQMFYGIRELLYAHELKPELSFEQYLFPLFELKTIILATSYMSNIRENRKPPTIPPRRHIPAKSDGSIQLNTV